MYLLLLLLYCCNLKIKQHNLPMHIICIFNRVSRKTVCLLSLSRDKLVKLTTAIVSLNLINMLLFSYNSSNSIKTHILAIYKVLKTQLYYGTVMVFFVLERANKHILHVRIILPSFIQCEGIINPSVPDQGDTGQSQGTAADGHHTHFHAHLAARWNLSATQQREGEMYIIKYAQIHTYIIHYSHKYQHKQQQQAHLQYSERWSSQQEGVVHHHIHSHTLQRRLVAAHCNADGDQVLQPAAGGSSHSDVKGSICHL